MRTGKNRRHEVESDDFLITEPVTVPPVYFYDFDDRKFMVMGGFMFSVYEYDKANMFFAFRCDSTKITARDAVADFLKSEKD